MNRDEVVNAAVDALSSDDLPSLCTCAECLSAAVEVVLAAAEPYIATRIAEDRERLAAAVEARIHLPAEPGGIDHWRNHGLRAAARIIRERP